MATPTFSVTNTRRLHQDRSEAKTASASTTTATSTGTSGLSFRPDLSEHRQKAAARSHRRRLHDEWNSEHLTEIKAKSQGTLASVLEEEGRQFRRSHDRASEEDLYRRRRQQVLALAFLITEAHQAKLARRPSTSDTPCPTGSDTEKGDDGEEKTTKRKFDIADPVIVLRLFSDINLLLRRQDSAKGDVTEYLRGQIAQLNMWRQ